jgi:D-alanine transaminase
MDQLTTTLANWNGEVMPLEDVKVSVLDRAFLFGDAVYEALRIYGGKAFFADEHFARLQRSLQELRIEADVDRVRRRMEETIEASGVKEGLAYMQITRGQGPRSHAWKKPMTPNELIWVQDYGGDPHVEHRKKGIGVVTESNRRWGRCDVKSVNLLANCMACQAAYEAGCIEAILIDDDGIATEATHSSLFGVLDGVVRTSPNNERILPGVTRNWAVDRLRKLGIPVSEESMQRSDFDRLEEMFLTGTSIEVMPVTSIDRQIVANGKPGTISVRLLGEYQSDVRAFIAG